MTTPRTTLNFNDAPLWDCTMTIGGTAFTLLSPMDVDADMAPGPLPDQAAIDELTRRRAGIFRRAWWWLFGDPRRVRVADLPTDGGADQARAVARAIVAPAQRGLISGLKTAEAAALVSAYMAAQGVYFERIGAWAADQARADMPTPAASDRLPDRVTPLTPSNISATVDRFAALFGPPSNGYATGITPDTAPGFGDNGHVDGLAGGAS